MKKRFDVKKTSSIYWKNKANDFHAAALALSERIENDTSPYLKKMLGDGFNLSIATSHVFGYLAAVSIELNLKACIIENHFKEALMKLFENNEEKIFSEDDVYFDLNKNFHTHNLLQLAERSKLFLKDTNIINFLKILTQALLWSSRYPIPKDEDDYYDTSLDEFLFLPCSTESKLKFRKFNPAVLINVENYLKIWNITKKHYEEICIK